jgi:hypothetical protein
MGLYTKPSVLVLINNKICYINKHQNSYGDAKVVPHPDLLKSGYGSRSDKGMPCQMR